MIGNSYTCQIRNFNVTLQNQSITKVSGSHYARSTDQNVRAFEISSQICHFLPQRIKNFFPNIELLQVRGSRLKRISKKDLQSFPNLLVLHLHANDLESLDNDLFSFNPQLVRIDFRHQNLKLVGYKIFDSLANLKLADFQSSGCVDFYGQSGSEGIENLRTEIRVNCLPIEEMGSELKLLNEKIVALEAKNLEREAKTRKVDNDEEPFLKKLDVKFEQLIQENSKCSDNLHVVTTNFLALMERVETIEKSLRSDPQNCTSSETVSDLCLLEKEQFQRIKRELSAVDLQCEKVDWMSGSSRTCNVRNLKIVQPEVEIRKVLNGKQEIESFNVEELKVLNERVVFLPLKVGEIFKNLKLVSFVECGLITISDESFSSMKKLQKLILSHNKLQEVSEDVFKDLIVLTSLDLSFNNIDHINDNAFQSLKLLTELKLNDNSLLQLTAVAFKNQATLKFLFLQNNRLAFLPLNLLEWMKKLEFADFSNNVCINIAASKTTPVALNSLERFFETNCSLEVKSS